MLQRRIVYILTFFDIWGYLTGFTALSNSRNGIICAIFLHIFLVVMFTFYEFYLMTELFALIGVLDTINEVIQYTSALYTYWLIIFDSFHHRREHQLFWTLFQRIDDCFCKQNIRLNGYLLRFVEYILMSIILYLLICASNAFPKSNSVYVFIVLITICQIRVFYYIFCLEIVHHQLKSIENEISTIKLKQTIIPMRRTCQLYAFEAKRMRWIHEYYYCVSEMMKLLNTYFGWSQAAAVLFCFYSFATDLTWFYSTFNKYSLAQCIGKQCQNKIFFWNQCNGFLRNFNIISVISVWIGHARIIIFYLFRATHNCSVTVSFVFVQSIEFYEQCFANTRTKLTAVTDSNSLTAATAKHSMLYLFLCSILKSIFQKNKGFPLNVSTSNVCRRIKSSSIWMK